jgi:hypothetical protein
MIGVISILPAKTFLFLTGIALLVIACSVYFDALLSFEYCLYAS